MSQNVATAGAAAWIGSGGPKIFSKKVPQKFAWLVFCPTFVHMSSPINTSERQPLSRTRQLFLAAKAMQVSLDETFLLDEIAVRIQSRPQHSHHCLYMDCVHYDDKLSFQDGLDLTEMLLHLQHEFMHVGLHVEDTYTGKCGTRVLFVLGIDL